MRPKPEPTVANLVLLAALVAVTYIVSAFDAVARWIRNHRGRT